MSSTTSATATAPRVNFESMQRFLGRRVALVGQVKQLGDGQVVVGAADDADVVVVTAVGAAAATYDDPFVEVMGRVADARTIQEETHTNLGSNFDLRLYNEMVKLSTTKHADAFLD